MWTVEESVKNLRMTNSTDIAAETILQIERDIMAAIKSKDAVALEPLLSDEFVYRTHFGAETDKAGFLQSIASVPFEILSIQGEELNVTR